MIPGTRGGSDQNGRFEFRPPKVGVWQRGFRPLQPTGATNETVSSCQLWLLFFLIHLNSMEKYRAKKIFWICIHFIFSSLHINLYTYYIYNFLSSFEKLCNNISLLIFVISPANIEDSNNFLNTSFGALLPVLIKLCSLKYSFTSLIGFCFNIFWTLKHQLQAENIF